MLWPCLTLRDHLGTIFQDEDFAALFPAWGYPGLPPWRLALVTIMQFREQLSDRQAPEAVRARIDWKYLLGLELTDTGSESCRMLIRGTAKEGLVKQRTAERAVERVLDAANRLAPGSTTGLPPATT